MFPQCPNVGRLVAAVIVVANSYVADAATITPPLPGEAGRARKAFMAVKTSGRAMSQNYQVRTTLEAIIVAELTLPLCGITEGNG